MCHAKNISVFIVLIYIYLQRNIPQPLKAMKLSKVIKIYIFVYYLINDTLCTSLITRGENNNRGNNYVPLQFVHFKKQKYIITTEVNFFSL